MKPFIVTLTGPSCAGKSTLEAMLCKRGFERVISTTTRAMRSGEIAGEHYYFVQHDAFEALQSKGELVEWVEHSGQFYGITRSEIERVAAKRKPIVVVVEPHGKQQIKKYAAKHDWPCCRVFINGLPKDLAARFLSRFGFQLFDMINAGVDKVDAEIDSFFTASATRLAEMMTTERDWVFRAYMERGEYDFVCNEFHQGNDKIVVERIWSMYAGYMAISA